MGPFNTNGCIIKLILDIVDVQKSFFFFKDFLYLTERQRETAQAGGAAGRGRSRLPIEQGACCGARSQDPGTTT